ncbi:sigma-70 family RNA polymerase sigma factor, partial [Persicitalea sp.]|uniref:sigma-70 family RNA polymerase sigma factor n=1 Tax=Persicitalea sp. TaxID=3100273 RepID=UPI0035932A21
KNRVIDHYRQTTHVRLDSMIELPAAVAYPLFLEELESALGDAMAQLPEKAQQIFHLKRFEAKTTREIAEQLAIPERTVEYHFTQATRTLRTLLSGFISLLIWVFSTSTF